MKKLTLIALLISSLFASAQIDTDRTPLAREGRVMKKETLLFKVIPHAAVSDDWKTFLTFRNDQDQTLVLFLDFYGPDGLPISADFYDSEQNYFNASGVDLTLPPFGMNTIEFDALPGAANLSVFVFSDDMNASFGVETLLHNFQGPSDKVATVGSVDQLPGPNFLMNIDRRIDPYTAQQKIRGIALTNVLLGNNTCSVALFDDFGNSVAESQLTLPGSAKYVGTLGGLFPGVNLDQVLPFGLGVIQVNCDGDVSALGLAFELGTPIVGSIPIDYYENAGKTKSRIGR